MNHTATFDTYTDAMEFRAWIETRCYIVLSVVSNSGGHYALQTYVVTYTLN